MTLFNRDKFTTKKLLAENKDKSMMQLLDI